LLKILSATMEEEASKTEPQLAAVVSPPACEFGEVSKFMQTPNAVSTDDNSTQTKAVPDTAQPTALDAATGENTSKASAESGGKKRTAPSQGQGDAKRRKVDFNVGDSGIFYTNIAPSGSEGGRRDLMRLLDEALQPVEKSATPAIGAATSEATASKLEQELKELRTEKPKFIPCAYAIAKGTGFFKLVGDVAACLPSEVVARMLMAQKDQSKSTRIVPSSRHLCRIMPIDYTCKPYVDDFRKLAVKILPQHVGPDAEPTVWSLEFKTRNTNTLKKDDVLQVIDDIVPKGKHKVSLSDPIKCIMVEVNPLFLWLEYFVTLGRAQEVQSKRTDYTRYQGFCKDSWKAGSR